MYWFGILFATVQTPAVADSALALREAKALIVSYYSAEYAGQPEPCIAVTLDVCMQGEWSWRNSPPPRELGPRRDSVIARLEELAPRVGTSDLIVRQRVAFAIRAGNLRRARLIADSCGTLPVCFALRGLVAHLIDPGSGGASFEAYYTAAAEAMGVSPADVRCEWLLPRSVAPETWVDAGTWRCPEDEAEVVRFWWLADPLWSVPGNERRDEHLARSVRAQMDADVQSLLEEAGVPTHAPFSGGTIWQDYAFALKQGFPASISLGTPQAVCPVRDCSVTSPADPRGLGVRGRRDVPPHPFSFGGYSFVPRLDQPRGAATSSPADWAVEWLGAGCYPPWRVEQCGPERMVHHAVWFSIEHQVAAFRRGDSLVIAAAAAIPDSLSRARPQIGRLVVADVVAGSTMSSGMELRDDTGRARASISDGSSYAVSIEIVAPNAIGRARLGIGTPVVDLRLMSQLVLVRPLSDRNTDPIDHMLPSLRLKNPASVGIYFETYGIESSSRVSLALRRLDEGLFSRVFRRLFGRDSSTPTVTWQDERTGNVTQHYLEVPLNHLDRGDYVIEVRLAHDGEEIVRALTFSLLATADQ